MLNMSAAALALNVDNVDPSAQSDKQEDAPSRLTPVVWEVPPHGAASEYNTLSATPSNYSVALRNTLGSMTLLALQKIFLPELSNNPAVDLANIIMTNFTNSYYDIYNSNTALYCTQYRYTSRYPDAVKIVRNYYFDSARTAFAGQVVFYDLYI